ncbi:hypothetical protein JCM5350_000602 [Sporobolomyces pararoseus]
MKRGSPYLWFNGALPVIDDGSNSQRLERIRKLSNVYLSTDVLGFLPRLVNLQHLSVNVPKDYQSTFLTISRLRSFRLGEVHSSFDLQRFLAATAETIEDLQIPLETFFDLNLRDYSHLKRLELRMWKQEEDLLWTDGEGTNFWARAEGCPNLTTLAFTYHELSSRAADRLTGDARGLAFCSPPSLRRVDFTWNFSLDQLATLVSAGCISELGLVTGYLEEYKTQNENDLHRMKLIRTMCEENEVELIHLPFEIGDVQ